MGKIKGIKNSPYYFKDGIPRGEYCYVDISSTERQYCKHLESGQKCILAFYPIFEFIKMCNLHRCDDGKTSN